MTSFRMMIPLALTGGLVGGRLYHRWNRNWGATDQEAHDVLPGDDLVPDGRTVSTIAITVRATPEDVWPWLVQMGADRAGFYSHEWIENGVLHLGIHNANRIVPEWQHVEIGDHLNYVRPKPGAPPIGPEVTSLVPNRELITGMGDQPPWAASWQFVLRSVGDGNTRLVVRLRLTRSMPLPLAIPMWLLEPGFDYMSIEMLRGIAQRAEGRVRA